MKTSSIFKISCVLITGFILLGSFVLGVEGSGPEKQLIPLPAHIKERSGKYLLTPKIKILVNDGCLKKEVVTLQETFTDKFGSHPAIIESKRIDYQK